MTSLRTVGGVTSSTQSSIDNIATTIERQFDDLAMERHTAVRFAVCLSTAANLARGHPSAIGFPASAMSGILAKLDSIVLEHYSKALPCDSSLAPNADLDDVSDDAESLCAEIEMVTEEIEKRLSLLQHTRNPQKRRAKSEVSPATACVNNASEFNSNRATPKKRSH